MKFVIAVNLLASTNTLVYPSHTALWYELGKMSNKHQFIMFQPRRMSIDRMRNMAAKLALEHGADYLMFYDDDVVLLPNSLNKLLACKSDIAAGITLIRTPPFEPMVFKYQEKERGGTHLSPYKEIMDEKDKIVDVDAVGFSCALISCDLLKKLPTPYFVTGPRNTEDVYFCVMAKKVLEDTTIRVNRELITGHCLGQYAITPENRKAFLDLDSRLTNISFDNEAKKSDRGEIYAETVIANLMRAAENG